MAIALIDTLKQALGQFTSELGALRRRRELLLQQREELAAQCAARSDIIQLLERWVDLEHTQFLETLGRRLQREIASPPLDMLDDGAIRRRTASNYIGLAGADSGGAMSAKAVDELVCGLFNTTMRSFVAKAIADLPWPGAEGLPLDQRRKQLDKLDVEIDALSTREADLLRTAQEARVVID